jgi:hypothetical protein
MKNSASIMAWLLAVSAASAGTAGTEAGLLKHLLAGRSAGGAEAALLAANTREERLAPGSAAGVTVKSRDSLSLLAVGSQREWTVQTLGRVDGPVFVTVHLLPSVATVLSVGGARLGFVESPSGGTLQLMYDAPGPSGRQWRTIPVHVAAERYEGQELASMSPITVRLESGRGVWDLYYGRRLVATGLPVVERTGASTPVRVRGGEKGAWVLGVVGALENPLFTDSNRNGIEDSWERTASGGALLSAGAPETEREALLARWREAARTSPSRPLGAPRPRPDRR